jgi:hypothetical protein
MDCTVEMRQAGWAHFAGVTCPHFETAAKLNPRSCGKSSGRFFRPSAAQGNSLEPLNTNDLLGEAFVLSLRKGQKKVA